MSIFDTRTDAKPSVRAPLKPKRVQVTGEVLKDESKTPTKRGVVLTRQAYARGLKRSAKAS